MNAMKKLICLLLMLCAGTAAFAWGGREHRLIAYIAEAHLTPRTRQVLDRYLDQSIVEYSTWMDRYRTAPGYEITTYWHMVTIDKDGSVPARTPASQRRRRRRAPAHARHRTAAQLP